MLADLYNYVQVGMNKWPKIQKGNVKSCIHQRPMKLSMNLFWMTFVVYDNIPIIAPVVFGGKAFWSLDFHCFKALNNNFEARLFLHVHFSASSDHFWWRVGPCNSDFFYSLGTVLTYAFNMDLVLIKLSLCCTCTYDYLKMIKSSNLFSLQKLHEQL